VDEDLGFEFIGDRNTAIITIKTFAYYGETEKFSDFVDNAFGEIRARGVEHLIVDLRGNDGGDPFCSTHLLAYIESKPVPYFARRYGQYEDFADPIPLAENRFEGKLLILIDGGCSSSTGHLCAVLDYHNFGKFVGGETGATYTCNDASKSIILDNTKLDINMPRMTFSAAVSGYSRSSGILPDYPVAPNIEDLVAGCDNVREYALELFNSPLND
jgi:C-terminal processing protease CtpA/Prc